MGSGARIVVYAAAALAVAFVGLTIAFFAINAGDENLSPEAAHMLALPKNTYAPDENLSFALAGMDAPPGASLLAEGQAKVDSLNRIAALPREERDKAYRGALSGSANALKFVGTFACDPVIGPCAPTVQSRRDEIGSALRINARLYERYLQLHAFREYFETLDPSVSIGPPFYVPPALRNLFLASVALRVKDAVTPSQRSQPLADLDADIRMWRTVLTGQGSLLSKFVAVRGLHGDYGLLGEIVGDADVDLTAHEREIEDMLSRMAPEDWRIGDMVNYEFRMIAAVYDQLARDGEAPWSTDTSGKPWWSSLWPGATTDYFKVNATKNLAARHMLQLRRLADVDGKDYLTAQDAYHRWCVEHFSRGLKYFYNPVGRILLSGSCGIYDAYPLRVHDIAGFHRLVRLAYEARKQRIPASDMSQFIRRYDWALHPVSGKPFEWDAEKRELLTEPLAETHRERRFRLSMM